MVMLLAAYAGAMWMFLTSAPKVYTMVSDMEIARQLYEGLLDMPAAEVPLHYYYSKHWARPQLTRCTCLPSPSIASTRGLNTPTVSGIKKEYPAARDFWSQFR